MQNLAELISKNPKDKTLGHLLHQFIYHIKESSTNSVIKSLSINTFQHFTEVSKWN